MKSRNKSVFYYMINIILLSVSGMILWDKINAVILYLCDADNKLLFLLAVIISLIIYTIKACRLYLIMLEKRITVRRFMRVYFKTMLVSIVLPFKTGELFRIYCYGKELRDIKMSFLSILIERYFDTIPLLLLLLIFTLFSRGSIMTVMAVLLCFLVFVTAAYKCFPSTYLYLNNFFIKNVNSEKGIGVLHWLEKSKIWYRDSQELVRGRSVVLLIISGFSWLLEYAVLLCLAYGNNEIFYIQDFTNYMNSVFVGTKDQYVNLYVGISALILSILIGAGYSLSVTRERKNKL